MQYAVKSFATRALDEWVLDYPQQVVMTTLNLVLTNEINDILEERQRQKELEDAEGSDNDAEGAEDDALGEEAGEEDPEAAKEGAGGEEAAKTAPAAAGGETQRDSGNRESQEEAPAATKKALKGTPQLKLSPDERRRRLLVDLFGNDFKPDERFEKAILQAKDDIQQRKVQ